MNDIGAVILAGGKSSRMGRSKALLTINRQTFLERIAGELCEFEEVLLSATNAQDYAAGRFTVVPDIHQGIGPMGGLYAALLASRSHALLALGCDMPFFRKELIQYIRAFLDDTYDVYAVVTRDGRIQPLCAVYSAKVIPILEDEINAGRYSLHGAMRNMRVRQIPLRHSVFADELVRSINTPEEYAALVRREEGVPIIAVCGVKHSGKTTWLTRVIPLLRERGLRVAVVKHDGHDFMPDVPGTDSDRLRKAGAIGVGVYAPARYMLTSEETGITPAFFAPFFKNADVILLEGGKHLDFPKIELVRQGISTRPVNDTLLALCSDMDIHRPGAPTLSLDDFDGAARLICQYLYLRKESPHD